MKKLLTTVLLLAMALTAMMVQAQNPVITKVGELDGANAMVLPKAMLTMLAQKGLDDKTAQQTGISADDLKNVESVQLISIQKKGTAKKARKLLKAFKGNKNYEILAQGKQAEPKQEVVVYAGPAGRDVLTEMILIIDQNDKGLQVIDLMGTFSKEKLAKRAEELTEDSGD